MVLITKTALLISLNFFLANIFFIDATFSQSVPNLKKLGPAPIFKATNQDSKVVSNGNFLNKNLVVNFFFTSCNGPCPVLMEYVRKLSEDFKQENLNFISFSVDPDTDTSEKLLEYKKTRNLLDPRINLLTVGKEELEYLLNDGYKLGTAGEIVNHSTRFVLIDKAGQIRITYSGDYQGLKELVAELLRN